MKGILFAGVILFTGCASAHAVDVFNLNVFDQLQGSWDAGFRARRMSAVARFIAERRPQIVTFQEAQQLGDDSGDAAGLDFPHRNYVYEMTGADNRGYGYWMGASLEPRAWVRERFFFPGGVDRRAQGAVFDGVLGKDCLGVLSLHLSYQASEVRQVEAQWLLDWLRAHETECRQWLVVGDFNADDKSPEMRKLFAGGLKPLYRELKPSIGAFNPIRRIYGENVASQTIDWALGWNIRGSAEIVLDTPYAGEWVSDHAGVLIHVDAAE